MQPNIRSTFRECIETLFEEKNANWYRMENIDIKKEWGIPVSVRTLYKIMKDDNYNTMHNTNQAALLKFFNKPFNDSFGIITLIETEENEEI